jgi:hypothetical protein
MARFRAKYKNMAVTADVPVTTATAASNDPSAEAAASPLIDNGDASGTLLQQIEALKGAEQAELARQRMLDPPPATSPVDDAVEAAKEQVVKLERNDTPDAEAEEVLDLDEKLRRMGMSEETIEWMHIHPQVLTDPAVNAQAQHLHHVLAGEGFEAYSEPYFMEMERRLFGTGAVDADDEYAEAERQLGAAERRRDRIADINRELEDIEQNHISDVDRVIHEARKGRQSPAPVTAPPRRVAPVSAPVSREAIGSGGRRDSRITLSLAQKEAAKISGISEEHYAMNLLRLREEKEAGYHTGKP